MENSDGRDKNVGSISIEEAIETMERWIEYEKANKDKINKADELILIQETILSDYKRLKEEFDDIDHECSRLEEIDVKKDMKIIRLESEKEELKALIAHKNGYTKKLEEDLFENANNYVIDKKRIEDKLGKLKVKYEKMRPYRDVSPHDIGYISGEIDILTEILSR